MIGAVQNGGIPSSRRDERPTPEWLEWGGQGPMLHLAHANGFPPGTYRRLAEALCGSFRVVSMAARPLWDSGPPASLKSWHTLAEDLSRNLENRGFSGVVGVGHSLGAVTTLLAADAHPQLFSAVVLVDPVTLTGLHSALWRLMKAVGVRGMLPIARGARRRREWWPDHETVRDSWAATPVFSTWQREVLEDYLRCAVVDAPQGGVTLRYPKIWEARVFEIAPHDVWPELRRIAAPVIFVHGEHTVAFVRAAARRARRVLGPGHVAVVPDTTHFVPMERPTELARVIIEHLTK